MCCMEIYPLRPYNPGRKIKIKQLSDFFSFFIFHFSLFYRNFAPAFAKQCRREVLFDKQVQHITHNIMYLDSAKKEEIFEKFGQGKTDTGSAESQIALFTHRISHLTEHMKQNRKDHSTERALTGLVGKRRALLNYLKARDITRYRAIVKALGLRK